MGDTEMAVADTLQGVQVLIGMCFRRRAIIPGEVQGMCVCVCVCVCLKVKLPLCKFVRVLRPS